MRLLSANLQFVIAAVPIAWNLVAGLTLQAQSEIGSGDTRPRPSQAAQTALGQQVLRRTATIHWQRLPLRDAIARLKGLFDEPVFLDRRIDPGTRVTLDIDAASSEEVLAAIGANQGWSVGRLGPLVYVGPRGAAELLRSTATARARDAARLPAAARSSLGGKQPVAWPRLIQPRRLIASIVEQRGWKLANSEQVPHDLWPSGGLPEMSLPDQLTVLLIGFDLTFELRPSDQVVELVPLKHLPTLPAGPAKATPAPKSPGTGRSTKRQRQVYTLRVQEQPVRAVLQEFSKRLHWPIQIDDESIRNAGKSLDTRVSFSVESVDKEHLLDALLRPAGLDYRLEGEQVRIIALRYSDNERQ